MTTCTTAFMDYTRAGGYDIDCRGNPPWLCPSDTCPVYRARCPQPQTCAQAPAQHCDLAISFYGGTCTAD